MSVVQRESTAAFGAGIIVAVAGLTCGTVLAERQTDAVKISLQHRTMRIDNDAVRVLEYRLKPHQTEPLRSHPPGIVHMLADARARVSLPDGRASVLEHHAGDLTWRGPTTHTYENVGNTDAHAIAVELRPCGGQ